MAKWGLLDGFEGLSNSVYCDVFDVLQLGTLFKLGHLDV